MSKILIPIDRSPGSHASLPVAKWLAKEMDAEVLILLCVGELPETPELAREEERTMERVLASAALELGDATPSRRRANSRKRSTRRCGTAPSRGCS